MKSNDTELNILQAAEREFMLKGFDGARTTTIAQAAGVTHAMLHYYFRTKEQLFERILDEKIQLMGKSVLAAFGEPGRSITERIKNGIIRHFDFIKENPDLPLFIINEVFIRPERRQLMSKRIERIAHPIFDKLQANLDKACEEGEIVPVDARMLMLSIMSLNVFTFTSFPLIQPIFGEFTADRDEFLEKRKEEIIETIMRRIKK